MKFSAYNNGYCTADKKYIDKKARSQEIKFPATFFYLEISGINILIDTGYSAGLAKNSGILGKLYSFVTKVKCEKDADEILRENNINPDKIEYIIISHFHPDHYGSLNKFPKASIICSDKALELLSTGKVRKIKNLILEKLIPGNIKERTIKMESFPEINLFENILTKEMKFFNILNLNEIYGFYLDGHAEGQIGLYLKSLNKLMVFDAVWSKENLYGAEPRKILKKIAFSDENKYADSLEKIKKILSCLENTENSETEVIITHDEKFLRSPYEF
jgi:glyoxylase-like metal-dependent hydrolase (beta-lactamase superfamily II)